MPSSIVYEVAATASAWVVRPAGSREETWELFPSKGEAIGRARQLGRVHRAAVRVLRPSGTVDAVYECDVSEAERRRHR